MKKTLRTPFEAPIVLLILLVSIFVGCNHTMPALRVDLNKLSSDTVYLLLQGDSISRTDTVIARKGKLSKTFRPDTTLFRRALLVHSHGKALVYYTLQGQQWQITDTPLPPVPTSFAIHDFVAPRFFSSDGKAFEPDSVATLYLLVAPGATVERVAVAGLVDKAKEPGIRMLLGVLCEHNAVADSLRLGLKLDCLAASDSTGDISALIRLAGIRRLPALVRVDSSGTAQISYP